jgi:hypothetical protein
VSLFISFDKIHVLFSEKSLSEQLALYFVVCFACKQKTPLQGLVIDGKRWAVPVNQLSFAPSLPFEKVLQSIPKISLHIRITRCSNYSSERF